MKRAIARQMTWWFRLLLVAVVLRLADVLPEAVDWLLGLPVVALALVRPPWDRDRRPVTVAPPVDGEWTVLNSPATKVPSHGLRAYGQTYAIDVLKPRPPGTPARMRWLGNGFRRPETFPSFGEPVLAIAPGTVVHAEDGQRDHRARTTWPALLYLFVAEGVTRDLGGARFVLGNHVVIDHGDFTWSAVAHLRRGSLRVAVGDRVEAGQPLGEIGNSGNTTEPHVHVQLMDDPSATAAAGIPFRWAGIEQPIGETDPSLGGRRGVSEDVEPGLPRNGQIFRT